jgi:hypothetical protein
MASHQPTDDVPELLVVVDVLVEHPHGRFIRPHRE